MPSRIPATIAATLLAVTVPLAAQEHGAARPEPVKVVPVVVPPVVVSKSASVNVTPTVPPAKVAAAVAEAIRQAEEAAAKRASRSAPRAAPVRRIPSAPLATRHYEVRWPTERMVVHWPGGAADDHVTLKWPDAF